MRTRIAARPELLRIALAVIAVAAVTVAILVLTGHRSALPGAANPPGTLADPVPYDGRSPGQPAQDQVRVLVRLPRKPLGDLDNARALGAEEQSAYVRSLKSEQTTLRSALQANG